MLDPYSMKLNEHEYAIKSMAYVKKIEDSIKSKNGGKTQI